jgi:hypothetical protein
MVASTACPKETDMALKTFLEAKKAYKEALKDATGEVQKTLQALIPPGYALYWTQGTPSFNDGDPCTFSQGDAYLVKLPAEMADLSDLGHGYEPDEWEDVVDEDWPKNLSTAWSAVDDDLAEAAFGDNVRVILTATEACIDDYNRY